MSPKILLGPPMSFGHVPPTMGNTQALSHTHTHTHTCIRGQWKFNLTSLLEAQVDGHHLGVPDTLMWRPLTLHGHQEEKSKVMLGQIILLFTVLALWSPLQCHQDWGMNIRPYWGARGNLRESQHQIRSHSFKGVGKLWFSPRSWEKVSTKLIFFYFF